MSILYIHGLKIILYHINIRLICFKNQREKRNNLNRWSIHAGAILSDKDKYKKTVQEFILKHLKRR